MDSADVLQHVQMSRQDETLPIIKQDTARTLCHAVLPTGCSAFIELQALLKACAVGPAKQKK